MSAAKKMITGSTFKAKTKPSLPKTSNILPEVKGPKRNAIPSLAELITACTPEEILLSTAIPESVKSTNAGTDICNARAPNIVRGLIDFLLFEKRNAIPNKTTTPTKPIKILIFHPLQILIRLVYTKNIYLTLI